MAVADKMVMPLHTHPRQRRTFAGTLLLLCVPLQWLQSPLPKLKLYRTSAAGSSAESDPSKRPLYPLAPAAAAGQHIYAQPHLLHSCAKNISMRSRTCRTAAVQNTPAPPHLL